MPDRLLKTVRDSAAPSLVNGKVNYGSTNVAATSNDAVATVIRTTEKNIEIQAAANVTVGASTISYKAWIDVTPLLLVEDQLATVRDPANGAVKFTLDQVKARSADLRRALANAILATIPA